MTTEEQIDEAMRNRPIADEHKQEFTELIEIIYRTHTGTSKTSFEKLCYNLYTDYFGM